MRKYMSALVVASLPCAVAMAAPGETWILMIDHFDSGGSQYPGWIEYPGAGYAGTSAWSHDGWAGDISRIYWTLDGIGSMGHQPPTTTEMYKIEFFYPTAIGAPGDWQPIESRFRGEGGEQWPIEPLIPWAGAWGTNHQWIGSEFRGNTPGTWAPTGPGPQVPESAAYNAGPNGEAMWLTRRSQLYVKWDFGWEIERTWSALRLTQVTCGSTPSDVSGDGDVDLDDFLAFAACFNGPNQAYAEGPASIRCRCLDVEGDGDVDLDDFIGFTACFNGPNQPPACAG